MQTETDDFPASFRMWAYSYTDTDAASFDVMSGEEIALRENGRWEPSKQYYWRWYAGQKLGFIACVPDPADNLTPPSDPAGSFVYETDPDLQKQQDLMIASIAGVTGTDYEKTGFRSSSDTCSRQSNSASARRPRVWNCAISGRSRSKTSVTKVPSG